MGDTVKKISTGLVVKIGSLAESESTVVGTKTKSLPPGGAVVTLTPPGRETESVVLGNATHSEIALGIRTRVVVETDREIQRGKGVEKKTLTEKATNGEKRRGEKRTSTEMRRVKKEKSAGRKERILMRIPWGRLSYHV